MQSLYVLNITITVVAMLGGVACSQLAQLSAEEGGMPSIELLAKTSAIQDMQNPSKRGSTVYLKGKVGRQIPLLGSVAYELQDGTGTIWVLSKLSKESLPKQGDEIVVKGTLQYHSVRLNNTDQGAVYVEQLTQLPHP